VYSVAKAGRTGDNIENTIEKASSKEKIRRRINIIPSFMVLSTHLPVVLNLLPCALEKFYNLDK
jgi:hypothetical protein